MKRLSWECKISGVSERFKKEHVSGAGAGALFKEVSDGWYIHIGHPDYMTFNVKNKPDFVSGDKVQITIEKID